MQHSDTVESRKLRFGGLSAFTLKILACVFMLIDHIGVRIFPELTLLRIIGRLAYPIFAFFIAEGCRYTKNKPKRFFTVFGLGVICEAVYILAEGEYYGNILLTFSFSILLIYALQALKKQLASGSRVGSAAALTVLIAMLLAVYLIVDAFGVDYGFAGVIAPLCVSLFDYKEGESPEHLKKLDCLPVKLFAFTLGLLCIILQKGLLSRRTWCLLAIPLLALYNGKPGKKGFKYGFYLFYPLHLVVIQGISWLMQ